MEPVDDEDGQLICQDGAKIPDIDESPNPVLEDVNSQASASGPFHGFGTFQGKQVISLRKSMRRV